MPLQGCLLICSQARESPDRFLFVVRNIAEKLLTDACVSQDLLDPVRLAIDIASQLSKS
jgi:hypothetical protein